MAHKYKKGKSVMFGHEATTISDPIPLETGAQQTCSSGKDLAAPATPKEVAEYSAAILTELSVLASDTGLTFLSYLIQVAVEEAKIQAEDHSKS